MKKIASKNVTIADLSDQINKLTKVVEGGFGKFDKKFVEVNERLNSVDERLNSVDDKIDEILLTTKQSFDEVSEKFEKVDERFDKIDEKFKVMSSDHENLELKMSNYAYRFEVIELQRRVEILEKKLKISRN